MFTFSTPQIDAPQAGQATSEIEGYYRTADGETHRFHWEGSRDDADTALHELFDAGLVAQASEKFWTHDWNLPRALPPVVARICGLDTITRNDAGQLVRASVNIW
jgi:hypothetical protein